MLNYFEREVNILFILGHIVHKNIKHVFFLKIGNKKGFSISFIKSPFSLTLKNFHVPLLKLDDTIFSLNQFDYL